MSAFLFHGPKAREAAIAEAERQGRVLAPPFGDEGLKVETSREIVDLLSSAPVGDRLGTIVIGPFDEASVEAMDAMLKTLEEFDSRHVQPFLWASDIESVIGTIRSRCLEVWCPGDLMITAETPFVGEATVLCEAAMSSPPRIAAVLEHLKDNTGNELALARAAAEVLARREEWPLATRLKLWEGLRQALRRPEPTRLAVLAAFLGES